MNNSSNKGTKKKETLLDRFEEASELKHPLVLRCHEPLQSHSQINLRVYHLFAAKTDQLK